MKEVTVNKIKLLDILHENREKHIKAFQDTIEGWRQRAHKELLEASVLVAEMDLSRKAVLKPSPKIELHDAFDCPKCHVRDYDRAIAMLQMSVETDVTISAREFDQFVNDQWDWSEQFLFSNAKYIS